MDTTPASRIEEVNVLVVDDHWQNLVAMTATLESLPCRVVTASSGEEALAAVLRDDFAVILLDVRMHGIDGFETARLIRERDLSRHTPVIFLTAEDSERRFVTKGYSVGAVDYLVKPVSPDVVRAKVSVFVDIRRKAQLIRRTEEKLLEDVQKRGEAAVRETAAQYEATLAEAPFGVAQATLGGTWLRVNQRLCDVLDASKDQLVGRCILEMVHPIDVAPIQEAIERIAAGELGPRRADRRFVCASGRITWIDLTLCALRDSAGRTKQLITVLEDISDRKRAEVHQRFLAEASEELLSSLDQQTVLERVAHLAVPLLGDACIVHLAYGNDGPAPVEVHANPAEAARVHELVAEVLAPRPSEMVVERDGGESIIVLPLRARDRVLGTMMLVALTRRPDAAEILVATDLAHRVAFAVENARLYVEARRAVRARDEFLSIASHELRTPLTSLQLQLQRLVDRRRRDLEMPRDRVRVLLERSERQVQRLALLIDNLLDVSRIGSGALKVNPEIFDLGALVRDAVSRFGEDARSRCSLELLEKQRVVGSWDRLRIEQVITNLLANAFKYGAGKPVHVEVDASSDSAELVIRDHGIGIAEDDVSRIFARYERAASSRSYGGLGLGLYIARQIVDAHGGTIRVDSTLGVGSTFTVSLPLLQGRS